jgi:hypothetical protein
MQLRDAEGGHGTSSRDSTALKAVVLEIDGFGH